MWIPAVAAGGYGLLQLFKDDLGMGAKGAAEQEINQGDGRGYDPTTGKIQRSTGEKIRDVLMLNNPEDIQSEAERLHIKNLQGSPAGVALSKSRPGFEFTNTTTQQQVNNANATASEVDPLVNQIFATNQVKGAYTREDLRNMDVDTLQGILTDYSDKKTVSDIRTTQDLQTESPAFKAQQDQQAFTNRMMIGQMAQSDRRAANQMEIAQMNQRLQMRREDRADSRDDRKDRQAMIMMLMKGLGQMGQGFAI